jgi:hypothetical protein
VARVKTKSGKVLTRKDIEAMADEAEAGYDLRTFRAEPVPGRPSLGKGVSPRISYRVPERLYSKAKARAKAEGRTVSELARDALNRYVSD